MPSATKEEITSKEEPKVESYTLRIEDPSLDLREYILRFQEEFDLPESSCSMIRTTQGEKCISFIKFAHNKETMDKFIEFVKKGAINKGSGDLEFDVIKSKHDLDLQLPGNLYIRGLLPTTRSEDLYGIFKPYGDIQSCKIIYDDYGFSKGYGFINFANKAQADEAVKHLNGCNVNGNMLFINHHVSKKDRLKELELRKQNYSHLYVKNIPASYPKDKLYDLFRKYGNIESVFLPSADGNANANKGYGFVNFKYHDDAVKAQKEMNGYELEKDYKIEISRAERKKDRFQYQSMNYRYGPVGYLPIPVQPPENWEDEPDGSEERVEEDAEIEENADKSKKKDKGNGKFMPPPFVMAADSNLISTSTGLPIAGPEYQDSNLYITHLPLEFKDSDLETLFAPYGPVVSAKVITYQRNSRNGRMDQRIGSRDAKGKDPETLVGKSKGFGFVCFQKPLYASKALVGMNGHRLDATHILNVSFAQRKENKFERGRLRHYNQNNLEGFYRFLQYPPPPKDGHTTDKGDINGSTGDGSELGDPQSPPPPGAFAIPPYEMPPAFYPPSFPVPYSEGSADDENGDDDRTDDGRSTPGSQSEDEADTGKKVRYIPYGGYYYYPFAAPPYPVPPSPATNHK